MPIQQDNTHVLQDTERNIKIMYHEFLNKNFGIPPKYLHIHGYLFEGVIKQHHVYLYQTSSNLKYMGMRVIRSLDLDENEYFVS